MPGQQGTASPLPSSSSETQGCLLKNNPRRQQDGAQGLPQPIRNKKHPPGTKTPIRNENPRQESSRGSGKGWERLPPSSPWPFLNIFSVACSAGLPSPNCPLPWGGVCSSCVPSKLCCDTEPRSRACPHCAPVTSSEVALQIPTSCRCHKHTGKGCLAQCLPPAIIPTRISGWEGSRTSQATAQE